MPHLRDGPRVTQPVGINPSPNSISVTSSHPDYIPKTISNWRLTFDGSLDTLSVEEFIYRANSLTRSSLRGNFAALCEHAHLLFEGKARNWFWRFHKSVARFNWIDLCENLKRHFKEVRTDYDVRDQIRNRKQKVGESFSKFFDSVMSMCDHLTLPLSERELIEILKRNLTPDIQLAILHLEIPSLDTLRSVCHRHENFLNNVQNVRTVQKPFIGYRRQVAEVEAEEAGGIPEDGNCELLGSREDLSKVQCWNCDKYGHDYKLCTEPRRVFCYGCGKIAFFLSNCPTCNKPENSWRDTRNTMKYPKTNQ